MSGLLVRTVVTDEVGDLLSLLPDGDGFAWVQEGEGIVGWGEAARIDAGTGEGRFATASRGFEELADHADIVDDVGLLGTGLVAFGSFTFDADAAGSALVVPAVVVGRRGAHTWLTVTGRPDERRPVSGPPTPPRAPDRVRYAGSSMPDVDWLAAVSEAVARIGSSELDKVVLARDHAVWSRETFDARILLTRLAEHFPGCFTFLCDGLVGATPELLVRRTGDAVASIVLAGSAPRGADPEEDTAFGERLLDSQKDLLEHRFAVRSVEDVLRPRCEEFEVDDSPGLLRLENVQHLATHVSGALAGSDPAPSSLELAGELHPTAAVGGQPRQEALAVIRQLEGMARGRYAGPVGWLDADGDGEWGIALRCAQLSGARARLFAGAGIVAGSLPEAELEETRLKLAAMRSAFEGGSARPSGRDPRE